VHGSYRYSYIPSRHISLRSLLYCTVLYERPPFLVPRPMIRMNEPDNYCNRDEFLKVMDPDLSSPESQIWSRNRSCSLLSEKDRLLFVHRTYSTAETEGIFIYFFGFTPDVCAARAIDAHQVRHAWAPGAMHVHAASSPRLSKNPFSLAATKLSSRTVTSSSSPSSRGAAASLLTWDEATNARVFFRRTPAACAISCLAGRWKS
jgi:hypothetical protein